MQSRSLLAVLVVLGASVASSLAKQCPLKAPVSQQCILSSRSSVLLSETHASIIPHQTQHKITFVNLKTIKIDGTAVAFIEE